MTTSTGRLIHIGEVLRYPTYSSDELAKLVASERLGDGCDHRNFYWATFSTVTPTKPARLEKGIWPVRGVTGPDGMTRKPAVLLRTSAHKAGTATTPWHDFIDHAGGVALYYGDKRPHDGKTRPEEPTGNRTLLAQADLHASSARSDRLRAAPLLLFTAVAAEGSPKGHVRFEGLGLITRMEVISQADRDGTAFSNYRVECALISLAAEGEALPWDWVAARRDPALNLGETLDFAPASWQTWVEGGRKTVSKVRRRLASPPTLSKAEQMPEEGSVEDRVLDEVIAFYDGRKGRFEALAARVMEERLKSSGRYVPGWLTRPSADGGYDMVGRLDVGEGTRPVQLVVLGQAKCVHRTGASAEQLARLVARLRRGWFGVFVTTGYFSRAAQEELVQDEYPVMLIDGRQIAESVRQMAISEAADDVGRLLESVDATYEGLIRDLGPEQVLNQ